MQRIMRLTEDRKRLLVCAAVAASSALLLAFVVLAHVRQGRSASHLVEHFSNSLHGPGFAFVAITVFAILRIFRRSLSNYLYAGAISMAIGVLSEAAQIPGPRDASASDLVADLLGTVAGLGLLAVFDALVRKRFNRWAWLGVGAVTVVTGFFAFAPAVGYAYAGTAQWQAMPTILTFERIWERASFRQTAHVRPTRMPAPQNWPVSGNIAKATEAGHLRTLIRIEPNSDWHAYRELSFVAASADDRDYDVEVVVRELPDSPTESGSRYGKMIALTSQPNTFVISLEDVASEADLPPFDMTRISSISIFATGDDSDVTILMDDFRLR